jgi:carboxymethylenebutenolidase
MEVVTLSVAKCPDIDAYLAVPNAPTTAGIVVLQEIFGVNAHIQDLVRRYAEAGYMAIAPAIFDVETPGVVLEYDADGMQRGRDLATAVGFERALQVIKAARDALHERGIDAVGTVGFCWGGSWSYLANTRLGMPGVSYYGARSMPFMDEKLRAPMQFHFGENDASIPASDIETTRRAHPEAEVYVYPDAGHAFNRDVDPSHYHAASAQLANDRTLRFFRESLI